MMSTGSGQNQLWNYFLRTKAGDSAICNVCKKKKKNALAAAQVVCTITLSENIKLIC